MPTVLYAITAIHLSRRRPWAVVVGLVTVALQFSLTGLFIFALFFRSGGFLAYLLASTCELALLQLILHLMRSAEAIRLESDQQRGFEVLPIVRAAPIEAQHIEEK